MSSDTIYSRCSCIVCKKECSTLGIASHFRNWHITHPPCSCIICKQEYTSASINNHYTNAHSERIITQESKKRDDYYKSPISCKHCNTIIHYDRRQYTFCNSSCAATYNNSKKDWSNIKTGPAKKPKEPKEPKPVNPYPFSKLINCTCKHCGLKWLHRSCVWYCKEHQTLYSHSGRAKFWFTFNVFNYPSLFDLSLITQFGFRNSQTNPNGITRDHRVSVNHAIKNDYDPYYIKHPLNCELMPFNENNSKKTNSSISYEELVHLVDEYDRD